MSTDAGTTEDSRSAGPARPDAAPRDARLCLFPAHLVALVLLVLVALFVAHGAAGSFRAGQAAGAFTEDVRRTVAFGLLFNVAIALALVLAWIAELVMALGRMVRGTAPASRALARLGLALVPTILFVAGHRIFNPWLPDLIRQVSALARGV